MNYLVVNKKSNVTNNMSSLLLGFYLAELRSCGSECSAKS